MLAIVEFYNFQQSIFGDIIRDNGDMIILFHIL